MKKKYSLEDYEQQYGVLREPFALKLIVWYLLKHYLLAFIQLITLIPKIKRMVSDVMPIFEKFAYSHSTFLFVLSCIPVLLVFISSVKRVPKTESPFLRKVWSHGRILLITTAILEIILIMAYVLLQLRQLTEFWLIILYIDVIVLIYLVRSVRVKDVFAEFPEYEAEKK